MKFNLFFALGAFLAATGLFAQQGPLNSKNGVAVSGYDITSYWNGKPVKGSTEHAYTHQGATYYFASEANQKKFATDPLKYLPEYGGYCAYAMAKSGDKVKINPETYEIRDNRLLLFYNQGWTNTLSKWEKEGPDKLLPKADDNWKKYLE